MTQLLTRPAGNRQAVNSLLEALDFAASDLGYGYVAELLDMDVNTLRMKLDGDNDITLTELQQLAIATSIEFTIEVRDA